MRPDPIPKQPVFEPRELRSRKADLPSLLDLPNRIFTRSGRSALVLALDNCGVRPGDSVLVPSYHCPTMIAPVEHLGATPIFYPITGEGAPDIAAISPAQIDKSRAMLVAHLFGIPLDLREIRAFCTEHKIALIEDCAHCFFGSKQGIGVGQSGDFAIGSLPKFFPVIEGGLLVSRHRANEVPLRPSRGLFAEARAAWDVIDMSALHGHLGLLLRRLSEAKSRLRYRPPVDLEAGAGTEATAPAATRERHLADDLLLPQHSTFVEAQIVQHYDLATCVNRRRRNFAALLAAMRSAPGVGLPITPPEDGAAPYVLPILVNNADAVFSQMRVRELPVFRWDRIWPNVPDVQNDIAMAWSRSLIQIACHQSLSERDVAEIIDTVQLIVRRHRSDA
jgi:dTDP-4-amino-4,6-dideoxygalactose transaminase